MFSSINLPQPSFPWNLKSIRDTSVLKEFWVKLQDRLMKNEKHCQKCLYAVSKKYPISKDYTAIWEFSIIKKLSYRSHTRIQSIVSLNSFTILTITPKSCFLLYPDIDKDYRIKIYKITCCRHNNTSANAFLPSKCV